MNTRSAQTAMIMLAPLIAEGVGLAQDCGWRPAALVEKTNEDITALGVFDMGDGQRLYAGGWFRYLDGRLIPYFARLDDDAGWSPVGTGTNGPVKCMMQYDDGTGPSLYVGGAFDRAGEVEANSIARWDGQSWYAIGYGLEHEVNAMAIFDDGSGPSLYAGGQFVWSWPNMTRYLARWDGQYWKQVGTISSFVQALTVWDDGTGRALYVGGEFKTIDNKPIAGIAKWDGQVWSDVGGSAIGKVWTFAEFDDGTGTKLFAGGGGVNRWDGHKWSAVPGFEDVDVATMIGHGGELYVGGSRRVDGDRLGVVLRWNGSTVVQLAAGHGELSGWVSAVTMASDSALYVGGRFTEFGGASIMNFATQVCPPCPADCDSSGALDIFDYLCYINAFAAADLTADCDGSGELDLFDFACFANSFDQGC